MEPREIRMELTEAIIQDLLWRTLLPEAIVMTQSFNDALAEHAAMIGISPDDGKVTGVNVVFEQGKVFAELTYS